MNRRPAPILCEIVQSAGSKWTTTESMEQVPPSEGHLSQGDAVGAFLERLAGVGEWDDLARSQVHGVAARKALLASVEQIAREKGRIEELEAAVVRAWAAPIEHADIGEPDLGYVRQAIAQAAMALAVRDVITPEEFWSLYAPFAALIPIALPPGNGPSDSPWKPN